MNGLKIFENIEFGSIRTLEINGVPYFVGKDVAQVLGYQNGSRDINRHVDEEDRLTESMVTSGQNREVILINESGLYSLILSSNMPIAKQFKRWVTSEVLPAIRTTGGYVNSEDTFIDTYLPFADTQTKAMFRSTLETVRHLNSKIQADKPKVLFAEAVETAKTSILIGELAKIIKQNGVDMGQNRLFKWLRNNGYLIKSSNMPTQRAMDMKLFEIKEHTIRNPDGSIRITRTPKVTGKGQQYFINKFLNR